MFKLPMSDRLSESFAQIEGESAALKVMRDARHRAEARAMKLLSALECPADLIEWGRSHRIENFALLTWQAGFEAGMRAAEMPVAELQDALVKMATQPAPDRKLWLWNNGDHFWAFDQEIPCYPNGDPMTVGEPIGWAWLKACDAP